MWRVSLLILLACHQGISGDTDSDTALFPQFDPVASMCNELPETLTEPPSPVSSYPWRVTSNGWTAARWNLDTFRLDAWWSHLPQQPYAGVYSKNLLYDLYFGIKVEGSSSWLVDVPPQAAGMEPGTGILFSQSIFNELQITTYVFTPFHSQAERALVALTVVENIGDTPHNTTLFSLQNTRPGAEPDGETIDWNGHALTETDDGRSIIHTPISTPSAYTAAPSGNNQNPWNHFPNDFQNLAISGSDLAVGYQWNLNTIQPGESISQGIVLSWEDDSHPNMDIDAWIAGRTAIQILEDERLDWQNWHNLEVRPALASEEEWAVYQASTTVLRMAQVRTPGAGYGQLLASLPPGSWNITWPRDAAYAIVALVNSGHSAEAKDALEFFIQAEAGDYASWINLDDYLISLTRYRGDGVEESDTTGCTDGTDAGPNIELDNWGLFLWAYTSWAAKNPDDPWLTETLPIVEAGVGEPLLKVIDPNRNLLIADSSIWERHWNSCFPNGRKQFSYSSIQAAAGLKQLSYLTGNSDYMEGSEQLLSGLLTSETDLGPIVGEQCPFLASAPEEICDGCGPYDGSVIELINQELVPADSGIAVGTALHLSQALAINNGSPGFLRNDDGSGTINPFPWYDDQEWVVIDLRFASAFHRIGVATGQQPWSDNADHLLDWITKQASKHDGLIAELLSDGIHTSDDDLDGVHLGVDLGSEYQGAIPMVGFGAGAYILAIHDLREASP